MRDRQFWIKIGGCIAGSFISAIGINFFIVPMGCYNGGFLGISQIIRTLLIEYAGLNFPFDIQGVLYFFLNIPVLLISLFGISRSFFARTLLGVAGSTIFLSLIPGPAAPLIADRLTSCVIGGIICGTGNGLLLKSGGSSGGSDPIGIFLVKKIQNFSVGRLNLAINAFVYGACLILFDAETAIYSVIYSVFLNIVLDRVYTQNINVKAFIMTQSDGEAIRKVILEDYHRGVTIWDAVGGYTGKVHKVLFTVLSKYEATHLRHTIGEIDPGAFMVMDEGSEIFGRFEKHLQ